MKKIVHSFLCLTFALSTTPFKAWAVGTTTPGPMHVYNEAMPTDIAQLKTHVLNQERMIRDEEILTQQLARENAALLEKFKFLEQLETKLKASPERLNLAESIRTLDQLRWVMERYSRQLDERNQQMMARNEQTIELRARIEKLESLYKDVLSINSSMEQMKRDVPSVKQEELASRFADQKDFLLFKQKTLDEQYQQIIDFKTQLSHVQEELQSLQTRYQGLTAQQEDKAKAMEVLDRNSVEINKTTERLKTELTRLQESQGDLKAKDEQIAQLQEQILKKDAQIAELKNDLMSAQQEASQLKKQVATKDKTIAQQQKSMDKLASEMGTMQQGVVNIKNEYEGYNNTLDDIRSKVVGLKDQLKASQEQVIAKEQIIVKQQESMNALSNEMSTMQEGVSEIKSQYEHYNNGFEQIRVKVVELKDKLAKAQTRAAEADVQEQALANIKNDMAELTTQLKNSRGDVETHQAKIKELTVTIEDLNRQLIAKSKDIEDKDMQVKELKAEVAQLTKQVNALKSDLAQLATIKERVRIYDALVSKYQMLQQLMIQKVDLLTQSASRHQDNAQFHRNLIKQAIADWDILNEEEGKQIAELKQVVLIRKDDLKLLRVQVDDGKKHSAQLESMLDVYQKKADNQEETVKAKTLEVDQLQGDLQTVQESLAQREQDLKKVQEYFYEFEQRSSAKAKDLKDRTEEVDLLKATLNTNDQNLTEFATKIDALQEKLKGSINDANAQKDEYQSLLDKRTVDEQDMAALKEKLAAAEKKLESSVDQEIVEQQKKEIAQLTVVIKDYQERLKSSVDRTLFDQQRETASLLNEKLVNLEQKLKNSVDSAEIEDAKQFIKSANDEVATLKASLKVKDAEVEQLNNTQQVNQDNLEKQLSVAQSKIKTMMEDLHAKDMEIKRLKMQASPHDQTIKPVEQVPAAKAKDYKGESSSVSDLREQLILARNEIAEARAAASDKSRLASKLDGQIKDLNETVKKLEQKLRNLKGDPNDEL